MIDWLIDFSFAKMPDNNALHTAAKAGDIALVQSQVSNFDINAKGEFDQTALVKAAQYGYSEVVKLLPDFKCGREHSRRKYTQNDTCPSDICISFISMLHPTFHTSRHVLSSL